MKILCTRYNTVEDNGVYSILYDPSSKIYLVYSIDDMSLIGQFDTLEDAQEYCSSDRLDSNNDAQKRSDYLYNQFCKYFKHNSKFFDENHKVACRNGQLIEKFGERFEKSNQVSINYGRGYDSQGSYIYVDSIEGSNDMKKFKKTITCSSDYEESPLNYIISCLQDEIVKPDIVLGELLDHVDERAIAETIVNLGLDEGGYFKDTYSIR